MVFRVRARRNRDQVRGEVMSFRARDRGRCGFVFQIPLLAGRQSDPPLIHSLPRQRPPPVARQIKEVNGTLAGRRGRGA